MFTNCPKCNKKGIYNVHETRRGYKVSAGKVTGKQCRYCHAHFTKDMKYKYTL